MNKYADVYPRLTPRQRKFYFSRAILGDDISTVKNFLRHGFDPNVRLKFISGTSKTYPLEEAIKHSGFDMIETLINEGVDPMVEIGAGRSTLDLAISTGNVNVAKLLYSKGVRPTNRNLSSVIICYFDNLKMVEFLLSIGVDPNGNNGYDTILQRAVCQQLHGVIEILLLYGADPNKIIQDNPITPLALAVRKRDLETVKLLLNAGSNPNVNISVISNMHILEYAGHYDREIFRELLKAGSQADLNKFTLYGKDYQPIYLEWKNYRMSLQDIIISKIRGAGGSIIF